MLKTINHIVFRSRTRVVLIGLVVAVIGVSVSSAQQRDPFSRDPHREEEARIVKEMLSKQQTEREKKEHEELLKRADSVLDLSSQLENAFDASPTLSAADAKKLMELEKVVRKIRDELGGDDDETEEEKVEERPRDVREAFAALRKSAVNLVEEVKKTTRFSISAAAIQSSNAVLRLVRFLRFRN